MQSLLLSTVVTTLWVVSTASVSAQGVPVAVTHYDLLNGYGQASSGSYHCRDMAYSGSGNVSLDVAPLSGGLVDPTDGVMAHQRWVVVANLEATGPCVGWTITNPAITLHFASVQSFSQVVVRHDDANGYAPVATPTAVKVTVSGQTQRFEIADPPGNALFASTLVLSPGVIGAPLQLQVIRRDSAGSAA